MFASGTAESAWSSNALDHAIWIILAYSETPCFAYVFEAFYNKAETAVRARSAIS